MRKLLTLLVAFVLGISTASAQGIGVSFGPGPGMAHSTGGGAVTVSGATTTVKDCAFAATCTTNAVTIPSGFVVFGVGGANQGGSAQNITSVTLNSPCSGTLTAAENPSAPANQHYASLFAGTVTGGSCTITVALQNAFQLGVFGVALEALSNVVSTTAGTGCSNSYSNAGVTPYACSTSITIASSGVAVAVLSSSTAGSLSSSNLTIDAQSAGGSGLGIAIAHSSAAGSITPSFTTTTTFDISSISAAPWR